MVGLSRAHMAGHTIRTSAWLCQDSLESKLSISPAAWQRENTRHQGVHTWL